MLCSVYERSKELPHNDVRKLASRRKRNYFSSTIILLIGMCSECIAVSAEDHLFIVHEFVRVSCDGIIFFIYSQAKIEYGGT